MSGKTMARLDPTAVTRAPGQQPFTPEPLIKHMLMARRCISGSVFMVEGIDILSISEAADLQAVRLLLGDGELCVQALLHSDLFHLVDSEDVYVGCYVRVEDVILRFEEAPDDDIYGQEQDEGSMVYLIVNELETIGWNESYVAMWQRHQKGKAVERRAAAPEEEELAREEKDTSGEETPTPKRGCQRPRVEDPDDAFETSPSCKPTQRREISSASASTTTASKPRQPRQPIALPRDWRDPQTPLKLTTLRSIPHLPYAQNWSVNVLAIVASLSPVEPSHLPPGKQRTARITDPSTAKQVHLTVFLDPEGFTPAVGSAVLLTGVKNHRFDGGSLKKYASDGRGREQAARWWFEEPREMQWLDIGGIKAWWAEMQRSSAVTEQKTA